MAASEFGYVYVIDAERLRPMFNFSAHNNAIFDVKWRPEFDNQILTASGDQSLALWNLDALPGERLDQQIHNAHLSSIKSTSFMDSNIVASGARDGAINVWDLRCPKGIVKENNIS